MTEERLLELLKHMANSAASYAKQLGDNGDANAATALDSVAMIFGKEALRIEHPELFIVK